MKTEIKQQEGMTLITVQGELDTDTCIEFQQETAPVAEVPGAKVELDLSALDYISSKALRIIISLEQRVAEHGGSLTITAVSAPVREIFDMTGLSQTMLSDCKNKTTKE